jgi:hypothetical protein
MRSLIRHVECEPEPVSPEGIPVIRLAQVRPHHRNSIPGWKQC